MYEQYALIKNKLRNDNLALALKYIEDEKLRDTFLIDIEDLIRTSLTKDNWEVSIGDEGYFSYEKFDYYDWPNPNLPKRGFTISIEFSHDLTKKYNIIRTEYKREVGSLLRNYFKGANGLSIKYEPLKFSVSLFYMAPLRDLKCPPYFFTTGETLELIKRVREDHNKKTLKLLEGYLYDRESDSKEDQTTKELPPVFLNCREENFIDHISNIVSDMVNFKEEVYYKEGIPKIALVCKGIPFPKELKRAPTKAQARIQAKIQEVEEYLNHSYSETIYFECSAEEDTLSIRAIEKL